MKAIVTGANGFVGSALVKELVANKVEVLAIDLSFNEEKLPNHYLIKKIKLSVDEIAKINKMVNYGEYDVFYHFAWQGSAGQMRSDENIQIKNALTTLNCLKTAEIIGCKKMVVSGSIMELEIIKSVYSQEVSPSKNNIYSSAKVLAHSLCKMYAHDMRVELIWGYITNAYGVGENSPRLINTTIRKIINNEPLEFSVATQLYDFVYIDDVACAFYLLGLYGKKDKGYLIGSGEAKPLKEYLCQICDVLKYSQKPNFGSIPFSGVTLNKEDYSIEQIKKDCGFNCNISFVEGIKKTYSYLRGEYE